jgi:hypothetical protein
MAILLVSSLNFAFRCNQRPRSLSISLLIGCQNKTIAIYPITQYLEIQSGTKPIAANHQATMIPQFMLRVGHLKRYPEPVSLRRPVSWFVGDCHPD